MDDGRRRQVDQIRQQVSADAYRVDATAVAEAVLRRLLGLRQS
jgi:anti-sigma28 factor (negative regulator of flagellin synthesis)